MLEGTGTLSCNGERSIPVEPNSLVTVSADAVLAWTVEDAQLILLTPEYRGRTRAVIEVVAN